MGFPGKPGMHGDQVYGYGKTVKSRKFAITASGMS